jgi:hypothetical protein
MNSSIPHQQKNMKNAIISNLAILTLTLSSASAIELGDFIGSWRGKRTETTDGVGISAKATFKGNRGADGGLVLIGKTDTPTWGMVSSRHVFYKNGKYSTKSTTSFGFIIASGSGTWRKSGADILTTVKSAHVSGRWKTIGNQRFRYSGMSGETKVVLTGTRI